LKPDWQSYDGNDQYEGFCVDILKEIALICKFNYTIYQVKDGKYGVRSESGNWNGLVGELISGNADLALASLTINLARARVIDLTKPFLNLGLSILFKLPQPKTPPTFSFMAPLKGEIWALTIFAFIGIIYVFFSISHKDFTSGFVIFFKLQVSCYF
jgi:hypothetical protein